MKFLQIHWLASYPSTLLNRDDSGLGKRIPFGGSTRGRVSSQCLKRRWRLAGADTLENAVQNPWSLQALGLPGGFRSKELVDRQIMPAALALYAKTSDATPAEDVIKTVTSALLKGLYGDKGEDAKSRQALYFGTPEIAYLAQKAAAALSLGKAKEAGEKLSVTIKDEKANMKALVNGAGLEAALFGRMITSDPSANTDAAIHVAHALTVHGIEREMDFMSVVDDLKNSKTGDDAGAAGVFDMELSSGLYYGYVVVDVPLLISNLSNDVNAAAKVVEHLLHLIAEISPGAKKGSTAPYAFAEWMMIETGTRQPRTLANAFRTPLKAPFDSVSALAQLKSYLDKIDAAYGKAEARQQMAVDAHVEGVLRTPLAELGDWAGAQISGTQIEGKKTAGHSA